MKSAAWDHGMIEYGPDDDFTDAREGDPMPDEAPAAQGQDVFDWWMLDEHAQEGNLMRHPFSGDPWGPCSRCQHPAFHEIHQPDADALADLSHDRETISGG